MNQSGIFKVPVKTKPLLLFLVFMETYPFIVTIGDKIIDLTPFKLNEKTILV